MSTATAEILKVCESLSPEKQQQVADFANRLLHGESGDEAWERIIGDPKRRPKLDAFLKASAEEGDEPMDFNRL